YQSNQDSTDHILSAGFTTTFSPRLKWVLQGGAEARILNNTTTEGAASHYLGPFLETDVQYAFKPGSALVGSIRYGTEPSGVSGISIRQTLRGSLALQYSFAGRLGTDLGISYEHDHYDQPGSANDFSQEFYTASVGLRYQFNPAFALTARYEYSAVKSEVETDEYTRGVSTLGLEVIF
ncbi:MAG: TonB-dependent receptor, partial [Terrimicrobiaceae bacterium]|nr:TonB-dependent receptor [Terrimicrobiaceae bacterium]